MSNNFFFYYINFYLHINTDVFASVLCITKKKPAQIPAVQLLNVSVLFGMLICSFVRHRYPLRLFFYFILFFSDGSQFCKQSSTVSTPARTISTDVYRCYSRAERSGRKLDSLFSSAHKRVELISCALLVSAHTE